MPEFAAPLRPAAKPLNFPRGTLITPSASPPSSRPPSPAVRRKSTSRPPPLKRVRTESTHGAATPPTASTSSEPDPAVDNNRDEAWKLSSQRLLDKWAQLADRYNVPLDKDDIIDFRENKLVKDRGVTRRAKKSLLFGELLSEVDASSEDGAADENDDDNDNDIDNDNGPVPREQEAPVKVKLEMEKTNRVLSPFTEMNPADADDLKAFLAEEERRRQTGGIDDLEDDDENSDWVTEYDPEDGSRRRRITVMVGTFDRPPTPEDDSEDEFAKWEADDSTPRPAVPRTPSRPPSSDDIIDLTTPSPPSSPDPPVVRSRTPAKSPIRSFRRRLTEDVMPEAGPSRKPTGSPRVPARNSQLYTPPLSSQSSSEIGTPSDSHGEHTSQVPRAVSHVSDRPARANSNTSGSIDVRRATRPRQSSSLSKASHIDAEDTPKLQPKAQRKSTTPATRKRLVAEVVVPRRPKPNKTPTTKPISPERSLFDMASERPLFTSRDLSGGTPPRTPSRRNGKEVQRVIKSPLESSDDEPLPPPKPRAKSRPPEAQVLAGSSSSPSQRGHKRKRSPTPPVSSPIRRIRSPSPPHKSASRAKSLPPSSAKVKQSTLKGKGREKPFSDDELGNSPDRSSSTRLPTTRSHAVGSNEQLHPHLAFATPSFPLPVTPKRHHRNTPHTAAPFPPPLPMQDPQAQYHFAQAVHYLSYLFANGSAPGYVPPLPLPYSQFPTSATPQTPKRRMRAPRREASSSPGTGPSSSPHSLPYSPTHEELYQHHLDTMYSSGTPPPASSSPAPSPPSSPAPRTPGGRGRSKSRGRRVSFKLDPEDRPSFQKGQRAKKAAADAESRFADDQSTRGGKERRTVRGMGCHSDEDDPPMPKPRGERGRTPGPSTRGTSESVGRRR